jgi:amino acid adenylation domain-containing protein/non-ribosomal peptide synthase protein (TIGR01720 family)
MKISEDISIAASQSLKEKQYWTDKLSGEFQKSVIPYDYKRTVLKERNVDVVEFKLTGELYSQLMKLSNASDNRLHMIFVAVLNILLYRYTGGEDIILGTTIDRQDHDGEFINTVLPLRNILDNEMTFKELLLQVRETVYGAVEHQNYPLESFLNQLNVRVSEGEFALFDVAVLVENIHERRYLKDAPVGLIFNFVNASESIDGVLEYDASLYEKSTVERMITYLTRTLQKTIFDVNIKLSDIEILAEGERKQLLVHYNDTEREYPGDKRIHELFEQQVERTPLHPAAKDAGNHHSLSYKELNDKANRLAGLLRDRGVKESMIVGLLMERSLEVVVVIMGVLKAGGAYLPIDTEYPAERITYILKDSGAKLLVTHKGLAANLNWDGKIIDFDHLDMDTEQPDMKTLYPGGINGKGQPADLAYVIYTSGSTGKPKGVMIDHRGLVNYICWAAKHYVKNKKVNFPLYSSLSFDLTVTSLFTPLLTGNTIVVYGMEDKELLVERIIDDNQVGVIKLTPSHLKLIREKQIDSKASKVERLIVGGENFESSLARDISKNFDDNVEIYNEYGPTEAVVGCMIYRFNPASDHRSSVPIGVPADNVRIYIMDGYYKPVIPGAVGEICIAGDEVARGYLNRPELTNKKFLRGSRGQFFQKEPPGRRRLYKTGDLARWLPDGNIEFLGRMDQQVKIRGYRIEPGEVENQLRTYPAVKEAVVLANEGEADGDRYLCAYVVPHEREDLDVSKLREFLSFRLPDYMIPAFIQPQETIPLTPNGKIDKKALPPIDITGVAEGYEPPGNAEEEALVEIWQDVLGTERIGINDNFFMVGGDSIKSIQIVARMNKAGYKVEMRDVFENPQISQLAPLVTKIEKTVSQSAVIGSVPLTPIQKWFFETIVTDNHHFNQSVMFYSESGFDADALNAVSLKLQEHHDALRMIYRESNGKIGQINRGTDYPLLFQVFDYRNSEDGLTALEAKSNEIQSSINLETGPVMKIALFHLDDGDRLLVVIHHLVIDGVSWRILFEDIGTLYRQCINSEPLALPLKSVSFKAWAERLSQYANSSEFLKEKTYWRELEAIEIQPIKTDFQDENNRIKDVESLSYTLQEKETNLLLTKVNDAFGTEINDILLTALGLGITETFGNEQILIALEGHGREEILEDMDVSRTVGWFTSHFPVILDFSCRYDLSRQIKELKETLRRVPYKGVGYGILKYLSAPAHKKDLTFKLKPQIIFNYLGQFDAELQRLSFSLAKESAGIMQGLHGERAYELEVIVMITGKRLKVSVSFNKKQFKGQTIAALLDHFQAELNHLILYCYARKERELTPSDFTYKELTVETVDSLVKQYSPIEDIYLLSPLQEGMLFHALYDSGGPTYFEQASYRLHGHLEAVVVEKSLNELCKRHDILRTVFVYEGIQRPIQVVLNERSSDFLYEDVREKIGRTDDERTALIRQYEREDRQRSFDLSRDILMRVTLVRLDDTEYQLIWSFHHILMDGWCVSILNMEFFEIYNSFLENRSYRLSEVTPYRTYIRWLEKQDKGSSARYWTGYLEGYDEPAAIPKLGMLAGSDPEDGRDRSHEYKIEEIIFPLEADRFESLNRLVGKNHATLNTIIQAVWGIIIGRYNRKQDAVFGMVVSGRPTEIKGVETMVGLFINTIPVRIRFREEEKLSPLLRRVQEGAVNSEPHQYFQLAEIQAQSILKQSLLDHLLVFENYPIADQIAGVTEQAESSQGLELELSGVELFEQSNYDFCLVVLPGEPLLIKLKYNANAHSRELMDAFARHFNFMLDQIVERENEEIFIHEIRLLKENEKKKLLYDFNDTGADYAREKTLHELFKDQVEQRPDQVAVVYDDQQVTYRVFNARANRLARVLKAREVTADMPVGIMLERSLDMIMAIIAVLKAGGGYLPIDPALPRKRLISMLEDGQVSIMLTASKDIENHMFLSLQRFQQLKPRVEVTAPRSPVRDFDGLPLPDRSLVDYEKYGDYIGQAMVKHSISLQATRGCPYHCAYCHKIWPKKHVARSAENIFKEVLFYYNMGVRRFAFIDDIFNLDIDNSAAFFQLIIDNGLEVQLFFPNGMRGDILTKDYIDLMVKAGTVNLAIALETASPRLQKVIRKNLDLERVKDSIRYFVEEYPHVILELFTMHGFPTETEEEARMTLDFIKSFRWLHFPYVFILKIYPNTDMAKLAIENGFSSEDIDDSEDLAFHELPKTLPFDRSFTLKYQAEFLNDYFLSRERLLHVLPHQMRVLTGDEIAQKYDSYLPMDIRSLDDLLEFAGIERSELEANTCLSEDAMAIPGLSARMDAYFPGQAPTANALRVLLLDLSQFFVEDSHMLYDVVDPPLGLMYVMTYLNRQFGSRVQGKIAKSRIDFGSYSELKTLLEEFKPDIIGARSLTFYKDFFHKTIALIRQWGINVPIVAGGPYATGSYKTLLEDSNIDVVVLGEGEITFNQLIEKIMENGGKLPDEEVLRAIPGIAFAPGQRKDRDIIMLDQFDRILSQQSDENVVNFNQPSDLAYIIFTSGSTGRPKGVVLENRNVANLVHGLNERIYKHQDHHRKVCLVSPYMFDASVKQIFGALLLGYPLHVVPEEARLDGSKLLEFYKKYQIDISDGTPTHLRLLSEFDRLGFSGLNVTQFLIGGEPLTGSAADQFLGKFRQTAPRIINVYGPTECCVDSAAFAVGKEDLPCAGMDTVPIGTPMPNHQVYIVDSQNRLQPVGAAGELCIAGDGVARGYLNHPELTAEKFDQDLWDYQDYHDENYKQAFKQKFFGGSRGAILQKSPPGRRRLYKTGDLARWLPDGNIQFLGRLDHQVKIRGFRIELEEIESRLMRHKDIREALVAVKENPDKDKYMCAYYVPEKGLTLTISELRDYLSEELPEYAIPSYFLKLKKVPVTSHGKVDRGALPEPDGSIDTGGQYQDPRTDVEKVMVKVWQEVLGVNIVGIYDDYFALGGDSIKAIQIAARLHNKKLKLNMRDLFRHPTIGDLSRYLKPVKGLPTQETVEGEVKLTPIQVRFFQGDYAEKHHYNQAVMLYSEKGLNSQWVKKVFQRLSQHHDALRMAYKFEEEGEIRQINRGTAKNLPELTTYDLKGEETAEYRKIIEEKANNIQAGMDLVDGPLVKMGLFRVDTGDYLLIVIHHLVVDGISWRILLEDFAALYTQLETGKAIEELEMPVKTSSFQEWAESIRRYSSSDALLNQLSYWEKIENTRLPLLPKDRTIETGTISDSESLSFQLSGEYTRKLLKEVHAAYHTEINDILLTALGLAVKHWAGVKNICIEMEGHGREELPGDVDVNRTVGWFTSVYPAVIDMKKFNDLSSIIKRTKEMLRHIPDRGMGYGILKYITPPGERQGVTFDLRPQIAFNYLGQLDSEENGPGLFRFADISTGREVSLNFRSDYTFNIVGIVVEGKLKISIGYSRKEYNKDTVLYFADTYRKSLEEIVDHCMAREESEMTVSDFSSTRLTEEDIEIVYGVLENTPLPDPWLQAQGGWIKRNCVQDVYPLSPMQEGMLFYYLLDRTSSAYHTQISYGLSGKIDHKLFEQAFNRLIRRYDILRTVFIFEWVQKPLQVVLKKREAVGKFEDISHLDEEAKRIYVQNVKRKDKETGFDLSGDIPIRYYIIKISGNRYEFIWSHHHIIMDGWCAVILIKEMATVYEYLKKGETVDHLPPIEPYSTYIKWLERQEKKEGIDYWRRYLEDYENQAVLPRNYVKSKSREDNAYESEDKSRHKFEQGSYTYRLDKSLTGELNRLANENRVTLNTTFQTLWGILLQKYNNSDDVVFGSVVSGRAAEIPGIETMMGLFINTIPMRVTSEKNDTFIGLLNRIQENMLASAVHDYIPLAEIQANSRLKQELFNHIIIFSNYPVDEEVKNLNKERDLGFSVTRAEVFEQTNYDLDVLVFPGEELQVVFKYNTSVYNTALMREIEEHFKMVVQQVAFDKKIPVSRIEILSEAQKRRLLYDFNDTVTGYSRDKTLHELFEEQVERTPGKAAVVGSKKHAAGSDSEIREVVQLTYGELNQEANLLACVLRERGVKPGTIVGLMTVRSADMMVGLLGILKAGACYLPLDFDYPHERIKYILEDSQSKLLVSQKFLARPFETQCELIDLDSGIGLGDVDMGTRRFYHSDNTAYVTYTSGSTGKPKGVVISHRAVVNFIKGITDIIPFGVADTILALTTISFDIFGLETFLPLSKGSKVVLGSEREQLDSRLAASTLERENITIFQVTPSRLQIFLSDEDSGKRLHVLKYLLVGGEAFPAELLKKVREIFNGKIYNMYGPTETTIWSTVKDLTGDKPLDIGKPIANTFVYILNKAGGLQPVGITGELCIAGDGVARGYLNRADLTAARFVDNPFIPGEKMYRTGDVARWLPDGNIEFIGRVDFQVKIRGFRIELGEIENRLLKHPDVSEVVVVAFATKGGYNSLCAYYVSNKELEPVKLREHLTGTLPNYMIPSYFMWLEKIPLTWNGKIDRKAFPDPEARAGQNYEPPGNAIEEKLVQEWQDVLDVEQIGINDNFFDMGGDSIKAIQISSRLMRHKLKLEIRDLFFYPEIKQLSPLVKPLAGGAEDMELTYAAFSPSEIDEQDMETMFNVLEDKFAT